MCRCFSHFRTGFSKYHKVSLSVAFTCGSFRLNIKCHLLVFIFASHYVSAYTFMISLIASCLVSLRWQPSTLPVPRNWGHVGRLRENNHKPPRVSADTDHTHATSRLAHSRGICRSGLSQLVTRRRTHLDKTARQPYWTPCYVLASPSPTVLPIKCCFVDNLSPTPPLHPQRSFSCMYS